MTSSRLFYDFFRVVRVPFRHGGAEAHGTRPGKTSGSGRRTSNTARRRRGGNRTKYLRRVYSGEINTRRAQKGRRSCRSLERSCYPSRTADSAVPCTTYQSAGADRIQRETLSRNSEPEPGEDHGALISVSRSMGNSPGCATTPLTGGRGWP